MGFDAQLTTTGGVAFQASRGQHNDNRFCQCRVLLDPCCHTESIHFRHLHIQQH